MATTTPTNPSSVVTPDIPPPSADDQRPTPPTPYTNAVIANFYKDLNLPYPQPPLPVNMPLGLCLHDLLDPLTRPGPGLYNHSIWPLTKISFMATDTPYHLHPLDTKVYISVLFFFHQYISHSLRTSSELLDDVWQIINKSFAGKPLVGLENLALQIYIEYVQTQTRMHYGEHMAGIILEGVMQHLLRCYIDHAIENAAPGTLAKGESEAPWKTNVHLCRALLFPKALFPDEEALVAAVEKEEVRKSVFRTCTALDIVDELYEHGLQVERGEKEVVRVSPEYGDEEMLKEWCDVVVERWEVSKRTLGKERGAGVWEVFALGLLRLHFELELEGEEQDD